MSQQQHKSGFHCIVRAPPLVCESHCTTYYRRGRGRRRRRRRKETARGGETQASKHGDGKAEREREREREEKGGEYIATVCVSVSLSQAVVVVVAVVLCGHQQNSQQHSLVVKVLQISCVSSSFRIWIGISITCYYTTVLLHLQRVAFLVSENGSQIIYY